MDACLCARTIIVNFFHSCYDYNDDTLRLRLFSRSKDLESTFNNGQ